MSRRVSIGWLSFLAMLMCLGMLQTAEAQLFRQNCRPRLFFQPRRCCPPPCCDPPRCAPAPCASQTCLTPSESTHPGAKAYTTGPHYCPIYESPYFGGYWYYIIAGWSPSGCYFAYSEITNQRYTYVNCPSSNPGSTGDSCFTLNYAHYGTGDHGNPHYPNLAHVAGHDFNMTLARPLPARMEAATVRNSLVDYKIQHNSRTYQIRFRKLRVRGRCVTGEREVGLGFEHPGADYDSIDPALVTVHSCNGKSMQVEIAGTKYLVLLDRRSPDCTP